MRISGLVSYSLCQVFGSYSSGILFSFQDLVENVLLSNCSFGRIVFGGVIRACKFTTVCRFGIIVFHIILACRFSTVYYLLTLVQFLWGIPCELGM